VRLASSTVCPSRVCWGICGVAWMFVPAPWYSSSVNCMSTACYCMFHYFRSRIRQNVLKFGLSQEWRVPSEYVAECRTQLWAERSLLNVEAKSEICNISTASDYWYVSYTIKPAAQTIPGRHSIGKGCWPFSSTDVSIVSEMAVKGEFALEQDM